MGKSAVYSPVLLILLLVLSLTFVSCTSAQDQDSIVTIENPFDGEIIKDNSVQLQFTFGMPNTYDYFGGPLEYYVYLDGELYYQNHTSDVKTIGLQGLWRNFAFSGPELFFGNYTQGEHSLRVYVAMDAYITYIAPLTGHFVAETTINFYLYKGIQLHVSIIDSDAYQGRQTTFNIIANEYDSTVSYSLDRGANVTLPQNEASPFQELYAYNISLFGLPVGFHTLTVYATDAFNQTAVAEKTFMQLPMPLSTIAVIVGTAIAIVCVAVLLVYRKKASHAETLPL